MIISRSIHVAANGIISFFLWLSNIPLYICATSSWVLLSSLLFRIFCVFSHSVISDPLWPHGLQHTKLPCPLLSPGICSNSCSLRPSNHLILCHHLLLLLLIFLSIRVFSNESALRVRWPNYWSFSISPSSEYSGLIPLGMTDLISLSPRDSQEGSSLFVSFSG